LYADFSRKVEIFQCPHPQGQQGIILIYIRLKTPARIALIRATREVGSYDFPIEGEFDVYFGREFQPVE
jgi:hypothetical protein